jgi:hypothetical protein
VEVYFLEAPVATADPDTLIAPATSLLSATGNNPYWYDQAQGGNLLGTGNTYQTQELSASTIFYVEDRDEFGGGLFSGGMPEHTGSSLFGGNQFNGELIFDCLEPFTLKQVKVYTDTEGPRTIQLRDAGGSVLQSKTVDIPLGTSILDLDFAVEPGTDLSLTTDPDANEALFGYISPRLRRNNSGVMYPYPIQDAAVLKNSGFGEEYYYYFYDWKIQVAGDTCASERTAVEVVYENISAVSQARPGGELRIFPNPASGAFTVEWPEDGQLLRIWDAQGRLILEREIHSPAPQQISTTGWAAGNYLVQVIGKEEVRTGRLVYQR